MANRDNSPKERQNRDASIKNVVASAPWLRVMLVLAAALLALLLVAAAVGVLYWLRGILVPLLLATIVAYIFDPVVGWIERYRIPRTLAIIVTIAALIVAVVLISVVVAVSSADDAQQVAEGVVSLKGKIGAGATDIQTGVMGWIAQSKYADQITRIIEDNMDKVASYAADLGSLVGTKLLDAVTGLGHGLVWLVGAVAKTLLFAVVAFYLLKDFAQFKASALRLVPTERRERVVIVMGKIDELLRSFFRGQILVCLALAVIYAAGLSLLNVPFALILAFVGGLANIVPYLGLVLGLLPAVLLALLASGDAWHPLGVVAVFAIGQALEGTVLTPRIVGKSTNLHPVTVILSLLVFARLLGFVGLLLAVPTAAVVKVFVGETLEKYRSPEPSRTDREYRPRRRRPRRRRKPARDNKMNRVQKTSASSRPDRPRS